MRPWMALAAGLPLAALFGWIMGLLALTMGGAFLGAVLG